MGLGSEKMRGLNLSYCRLVMTIIAAAAASTAHKRAFLVTLVSNSTLCNCQCAIAISDKRCVEETQFLLKSMFYKFVFMEQSLKLLIHANEKKNDTAVFNSWRVAGNINSRVSSPPGKADFILAMPSFI